MDPLSPDENFAREVRKALEDEFRQVTAFSLGSTDDILDTLADIYLQREWFGPEGLREGAYLQEQAAQKQIQKEQYDQAWKTMVFGPETPKTGEYSW